MENAELLIGTSQTDQTTLLIVKIAAMFVLGLSSLGLGMLPLAVGSYTLKRRQKSVLSSTAIKSCNISSASDPSPQGLLTSLLLCFGGGVLLFTTFLHLAPEVRQSIERHQSAGQFFTLGTLSVAELLFCMGFFLVYFVEETVHATLKSKPESSQEFLHRTVSVRRCCNKQAATFVSTAMLSAVTKNRKISSASQKMGRFQYVNEEKQKNVKDVSESTSGYQNANINEKISPTVFVQPQQTTQLSADAGRENDRFVSPPNHSIQVKFSKSHHHEETSARGLLTVVALSFHAVFEGLAVGLEPAVSSVIYLAAAIATHKLVIAFCVGLELYAAGASKRTVLGYLSVLSIVTPLGIIIGLALSYFKNDNENLGPIPTILQGMAAGTLLYVVFFEVLARERANDKSGLLQLAAIFTGFMLMLGLQLATSHAHSHTHGHDDEHSKRSELELKDQYNTRDGKDVDVIADTIERLSSTVTEVVTKAYIVTTTESTVMKRAQ